MSRQNKIRLLTEIDRRRLEPEPEVCLDGLAEAIATARANSNTSTADWKPLRATPLMPEWERVRIDQLNRARWRPRYLDNGMSFEEWMRA